MAEQAFRCKKCNWPKDYGVPSGREGPDFGPAEMTWCRAGKRAPNCQGTGQLAGDHVHFVCSRCGYNPGRRAADDASFVAGDQRDLTP